MGKTKDREMVSFREWLENNFDQAIMHPIASVLLGIPMAVAELGKDGIRTVVNMAGGDPKKVIAGLIRMGLSAVAYAVAGPLGVTLPYYMQGVKRAHKFLSPDTPKPNWLLKI